MKIKIALASAMILSSVSSFSQERTYTQDQLAMIAKEKESFQNYKQEQLAEFENYKKAQEKAFKEYKKELSNYWKTPKLSTKKELISYSKDKKTRSNIDFEKNEIIIETIAKNKNEAISKLQMILAKTVIQDTKTAIENDPLEKKLNKIKKPKNIIDKQVDKKEILAPVIFKKPPTQTTVKRYVTTKVTQTNIKQEKSKIKDAFVYKVVVKLPKNTTYKRSQIYKNEVEKNALKQKLPKTLIFAIMHTESDFNPKARSHVPAYGLMQIVPRTAGIDSYNYLYKQKKMPSSRYLYNSQNNIKLGSAYLHILYYSYLKHIKNPQSRLYCTIAAYNTGAGNIAWAFIKTYNIKKASKIINQLTPQEVYDKLLKDLKYDEPKHYLKRVTKRMNIYNKIYNG